MRISLGYAIIGVCWTIGTLSGASIPDKATVCEVLDEGGWLTASGCPTPFITGGHVWPNSIFLQGNLTDKYNLHKVDFAYDDASEARVFAKANRLKKKFPRKKLRWTYEGLLETRRDWESFLARYPNGTSAYIGFGHLGEAAAQLTMKAVHDVSVIP